MTSTKAEKVLLPGDRAVGVLLQDGAEMEVGLVVSGNGIYNTVEQLLEAGVVQRMGFTETGKNGAVFFPHLPLHRAPGIS